MVVAVGGSAGALDAVRGLIAGLPARSGIAYILVQHLDPAHPSLLADLLADATPFPVVEITDGMALRPDRLHVIPSGVRVAVADGVLQLLPAKDDGPRLPVDFLLQSLARAPGLRVVAVLLSGNASDGSAGVRAIHAAGGYVIAQDPAEASHQGMPAAAIATGCVDAILPVAAMGAAIIDRRNRLPLPLPLPLPTAPDWIPPVLDRLRRSGHDFGGYKIGTMQRRIERRARMARGAASSGPAALAAYILRLDQDEAELQALANDLLINVTSFFRDAHVFAELANRNLPELVQRHDDRQPLRLWSAGCSSGEEAWSLAMLLHEEISRSRPGLKLQIFATDLDPDAIKTARHGAYPASIDQDVSAERLQRFFVPDEQGWRIGPALQASVVFAVHDLLTDPPFSRIDLVACRNLLIYLQPEAQARAISLFRFALRPGGLLWLGTAEAVAKSADPGFALVSHTAHLYRRSAARPALPPTTREPALQIGQAAPALLWQLPGLPSARLQALEAELASIRAELTKSVLTPGNNDPEQQAIQADTLSRNQEYQSTNEELITSQEELQSLNEELVALNGQLQETIDRQHNTADDLHNILNSTNIATIFLDLEGRIRFFTPATRGLFNMLPGDIGRAFADLAPITPDPALASDIAALAAGVQPPDRALLARDGTCFSRRVQPYRSHDNRIEGVIITFTDVTERTEAERITAEARADAETANLAKSRFLAAASHDLRQPLQSLVLLQELLARKETDPESRLLLVRLAQTLDGMAAMLDGLLDINRIDSGAVESVPGRFPLNDLLSETVEGLAMQAAAGKLKLRHVHTGCQVVSDRRLLAGMLRNLVANALKYTTTGGVVVGARRRGNAVRIEVWDSGIGIAEESREKIFEPYHQLGPTFVDRSRGLGLGLSIVRSLGEILGHAIDVRSWPGDGPGHGSVFGITVPLALAEDAPVQPPPQSPPLAQAGTTIMIIDDDAELLDLLGQLLRAAGHKVVAFADAETALAALAQHVPDLIISDFRLSGERDGLELIRALRSALLQSHGRNVPAIMLTGDISIDALVRFAAHDVVRLSKPVRPADLHAAIGTALGQPPPPLPPLPPGQVGFIHVIDDDPDVLHGLGATLAGAGFVTRLHSSAEAFRASWEPATSSLLLIDAMLPGESGLDLLRSLHDSGTLPPSIILTGQGDIALAVAAMQAGALDFIEKPATGHAIIERIQRALAMAAAPAAGAAERAAAGLRLATLTPRQRDVLAMVLDGAPSKNIAADLHLSQRTVESHRAGIMRRTGCRSLPELARLVMVADPGGIRQA